jgi:transglutaminase-like putative cysteine protease
MNTLHSKHIYTQLFVMMLLGETALFHTLWGAAGLAFALLFGGPLIAMSLYFGRSYGVHSRPLNKKIANTVAMLAMLLLLLMLSSLNILPALLVFIALIQLAQNFVLCRVREVYFAIAIILIMMLFSASESTSGFFIVHLAGFAIASTFVLVSLHSEKIVSTTNQSEEIKQSNNSTFPASITVLGFSILIVTTVIYLAMPQLPPGHIGSSFGVSDYYYQDRGWEREADNGSTPESSEPDTDATANDTGTGKSQNSTEPEEYGASENHLEAPRAASTEDRFFRDSDGSGSSSEDPGDQGVPAKETGGQEHSQNQTSASDEHAESDNRRENSGNNQFDYAGFNSHMNVEAQRNGGLSNALILYVKADEEVYLRSHVFDSFDGQSWHESLDTVEKHRASSGTFDFAPIADGKRYLRQSIIYEKVINARIVAANFPVRLRFPASVVAATDDGVISSPKTIQPGTRYTVFSESNWVFSHPASRREALHHRNEYLQVPETLDPRIDTLANELTRAQSPIEGAITLEQHLRENFEYTLDTAVSSQNVTPLGEFLFTTRKGHCEYFASALAIMLRLNNIPSRLVTGFSATNKNPLTGYFEVRGLDAHAWVEAYFPEYGWVSFEPTPAYFLPQPAEVTSTAESLKKYMEKLQSAEEIINDSSSAVPKKPFSLERLLAELRDGLLYFINTVSLLALRGWELVKVPLLLIASIAVLGAGLFYTFKVPTLNLLSLSRVKLLPMGDPGRYVRSTYQELEGVLSRKGYSRVRSDTIEEYQMQMGGKDFISAFSALAELYSQVAYGNYQPSKNEALTARTHYLEVYESL